MRALTLLVAISLGKASSMPLDIDRQGSNLRGARLLFARLFDSSTVPSKGFAPEGEPVSCPTPADGVCTREYVPVSCGPSACVYANRCLAELANFTEQDCDPANSKPKACPVPDSVPCTMEYVPVKCGQDECEYDNRCLAVRAGYVESDCTAIND